MTERPATKVGKHVIFWDGASRVMTWRERISWRLMKKFLYVKRLGAKITLI